MQNSETNGFTMNIDALIPPQMADKAESVGIKKSNLDFWTLFALSVLAGGFVAMGALFSTTVVAGASGVVPYGLARLAGGLVFCLGLILVVVAGAELFTGNSLIVMAWADRKVSTGRLLRNWVIVYLGNFVGAIITAGLIFLSGQYAFGGGSVGANALAIANTKCLLPFVQAVVLGILCNALVCVAIWLTFSARSLTDKVLAVIFPISAFAAAGFEHSVANMYFIPMGLFIRAGAGPEFWAAIGKNPADYPAVTWYNFLVTNLLPVTIGNIVGGAVMVGLVYWFVYLRPKRGL